MDEREFNRQREMAQILDSIQKMVVAMKAIRSDWSRVEKDILDGSGEISTDAFLALGSLTASASEGCEIALRTLYGMLSGRRLNREGIDPS